VRKDVGQLGKSGRSPSNFPAALLDSPVRAGYPARRF
jgi:hypothetical protein